MRARQVAQALGETRGWSRWLAGEVDRALVILLSGHVNGDKIRFSELFPVLRGKGLGVERTVEILDQLGVFDDDRVPAFEPWLQRKLDGLAAGIRRDTEDWIRALHAGGPRTRARDPNTVSGYLNELQPVLLGWSQRYDHLREVTREDILAIADALHGTKRRHMLSVLRSLFRHCKKTGAIFRDPTARIRVGPNTYGLIAAPDPRTDRRGRERRDHTGIPAGPHPGRRPRRPVQGHRRAAPDRPRPGPPTAHHRRPRSSAR